MGGDARVSSYRDAVEATRTTRSSTDAFRYSQEATRSGAGRVHDRLNPNGVVRECLDTEAMPNVTPIVFAMDVTRSRGNDAKVVYSGLMPFLGSLFLSGAAVDPQLLFVAFGDATSDRAPLQIGQFESDERMDGDLEHIWLEEGGGGTGEESAELVAYMLARKTKIDAVDLRGQKGFCFFTSDEAMYPSVKASEVKRVIGDDIGEDIPSKEIFAELQRKFHTYLIFPAKPMEERVADIDAEIRQRLKDAGGRFENCSIRASLIWNTYDDLDLHVVTPKGQHIYYGSRSDSTGGELDVDRNAGGRETRTPVENIRWPKGMAPEGKYTVFVRNYAHHEADRKDVDFKVELDLDGEIQSFSGTMKAGVTGERSDITAFEFDYVPNEKVVSADNHAAYADEVITARWRECIPDAHILRIKDARSATEVAIGVMSISSGHTLENVIESMRSRSVDDTIVADVKEALARFAVSAIVEEVSETAFA
jgi:hypothetical protein